jgi:eukaryotic-like serine/threonine-protein kinase
MPIETPIDTPNWTGLEGKVLEGGYEIEQCFRAGERSASFKIRVLGDRFTSAVAEFSAQGTVTPEQIALWNDAVQLRHPNLSSPLAAGILEYAGAALPYRVLVRPDETLGGVVKERSLTPAEVREVLNTLVNALEYLHGCGFTHSQVSPAQVLAIGDSIKLSTGSIRRINTPLEGEENPAPAGDVFGLGRTVFEVLTQKPCAEGCREEAAKLPAPFDWIVERALDPEAQTRCNLADIRAMLAGRQVRPAVKPEQVKPEPVKPVPTPLAAERSAAAVVGGAAAVTASPLRSAPASVGRRPVTPVETPRSAPRSASRGPSAQRPIDTPHLLRRERRDESRGTSPFKKSAYLLLALLVAVCVLWLARPKHSGPHPTVNSSAVKPVVQTPGKPVGTASSAWPTRAVGPPAANNSRAAVQNAAKVSSVAPATTHGDVWRVVSFTYNRESDAQKRVDSINGKYPGLHPEVFSPRGNGGPYLVVLGGRMTRDEATRLRQKARSSGLPRDSYIQNYSR